MICLLPKGKNLGILLLYENGCFILNLGYLNFWLFWGWIIGSSCFVFSTFFELIYFYSKKNKIQPPFLIIPRPLDPTRFTLVELKIWELKRLINDCLYRYIDVLPLIFFFDIWPIFVLPQHVSYVRQLFSTIWQFFGTCIIGLWSFLLLNVQLDWWVLWDIKD